MSLHKEYLTDSDSEPNPNDSHKFHKCQNQITISWHIYLRIFTESFVKFAQKLWEIYGKNKYITFFWTRCMCIIDSIWEHTAQ